jgi:uncharacterized RDD family membrane protein YckC
VQDSDEVRIETPEQIDLALEPAGLGSRFVAWVVDTLIWGVALGLLVLLIAVIAGTVAGLPSGEWLLGVVGALLVVLVYGCVLSYDIYFELRRNGQTPGKRVAGIRVQRDGGGPIDFRSSCIRNLLRPVDLLPVFYLLGCLVILLNRKRQRLGDLAAGTMVIRERVADVPTDVARRVEELASDAVSFEAEHVQACSAADRHILRSFFTRCDEMEPAARDQLACRLAQLFLDKTGYQPDEPLNRAMVAEKFLASLYRDLDRWARHGRK